MAHELLGPFIISMARSAADLLAVLLMARWTGCAEGLQIVPLFETDTGSGSAPAGHGRAFLRCLYIRSICRPARRARW